MAVPKRKKSRSRTRSRRAQWRADVPALVPVSVDGERVLVPPHLVRAVTDGMIDLR
ncbi:large subunit ribosomal protein L32 [Paraoerskovia marina]|uniref:Large ribosomal subunit protein bL32 n=1 Tax=Paraoerskovia marina TaxID=545619 RepID=A0A1H1MH98_9CELL|nr:50S ribosomal protein L32 [Paraoerskovia marina]SDR86037.1 large subunit ribosomal protein L32 [Paraoerskovia marina]